MIQVSDKRYEKIVNIIIESLPEDKKDQLLKAYFETPSGQRVINEFIDRAIEPATV